MSYNKIILLGNFTRDPQLTYTPNQTAVVDFGLATNRKWTGQDGSPREEVCFVDCRAWGKTAENINKFFSKGKPIHLEGRLTFESWTAPDGAKKSKLRVTVETFTFLPAGGGSREAPQASQGQPVPAEASSNAAGPRYEPNPDADIPF